MELSRGRMEFSQESNFGCNCTKAHHHFSTMIYHRGNNLFIVWDVMLVDHSIRQGKSVVKVPKRPRNKEIEREVLRGSEHWRKARSKNNTRISFYGQTSTTEQHRRCLLGFSFLSKSREKEGFLSTLCRRQSSIHWQQQVTRHLLINLLATSGKSWWVSKWVGQAGRINPLWSTQSTVNTSHANLTNRTFGPSKPWPPKLKCHVSMKWSRYSFFFF